jgi:hypothetical protein
MAATAELELLLQQTRKARMPQSIPLAATAVQWFQLCNILQLIEDVHLLHADPDADTLRAHRVLVTDLIADGEILALTATRQNIDFRPVGFTISDIESQVRLLRSHYQMWHAPMRKAEADKLLEEVFGHQ